MAGIAVSNILLQIVNYNLVPSLLPNRGVAVMGWVGFQEVSAKPPDYLQSHPTPLKTGIPPYLQLLLVIHINSALP